MNRTKIVVYSRKRHLTALITEIIGHNLAQTICCTTIEQTIATCQKERPTLVIILDTTPFINGSNLIEQIRPPHTRLPYIYVVSWQQSEQIVVGLLECGVTQYMTFPICMSRLQNKIAALGLGTTPLT